MRIHVLFLLQSFDDAITELDHLKEELSKDSTIIMQLLRDNLMVSEIERSSYLCYYNCIVMG